MSSSKYVQLKQEELERVKRLKRKEFEDSLASLEILAKIKQAKQAVPHAWTVSQSSATEAAGWPPPAKTSWFGELTPESKPVPESVALFLRQRVKGGECPLCRAKGHNSEVYEVYGDSYTCVPDIRQRQAKATQMGRMFFTMPFVHKTEAIEAYIKDWENVPAEWGETGY